MQLEFEKDTCLAPITLTVYPEGHKDYQSEIIITPICDCDCDVVADKDEKCSGVVLFLFILMGRRSFVELRRDSCFGAVLKFRSILPLTAFDFGASTVSSNPLRTAAGCCLTLKVVSHRTKYVEDSETRS